MTRLVNTGACLFFAAKFEIRSRAVCVGMHHNFQVKVVTDQGGHSEAVSSMLINIGSIYLSKCSP
jgi:hypothetical protein